MTGGPILAIDTSGTRALVALGSPEGVLIDDFSRAVSILRRLKSLGVQIALDDFGKGYSSLSYLQKFPFDKIKIDRSFIADLGTNQQSIAIVRAVIGLGRSLNIPILAEGVETTAQHEFLAKEGCNEGECGACMVLVNDRAINSCLMLAVEADGAEITKTMLIRGSIPVRESFRFPPWRPAPGP